MRWGDQASCPILPHLPDFLYEVWEDTFCPETTSALGQGLRCPCFLARMPKWNLSLSLSLPPPCFLLSLLLFSFLSPASLSPSPAPTSLSFSVSLPLSRFLSLKGSQPGLSTTQRSPRGRWLSHHLQEGPR